jgi:hypothetical protein
VPSTDSCSARKLNGDGLAGIMQSALANMFKDAQDVAQLVCRAILKVAEF